MKIIKRLFLYLFLVVVFIVAQLTFMMLWFVSKLIFFADATWSIGGFVVNFFGFFNHVLAFPFVWLFTKYSINFVNLPNLPVILNGLLWAGIGYIIIEGRVRESRKPRYQFIRG